MKLNCKIGDLAVIVRSVSGNEGRIVRCLKLDPDHLFIGPSGEFRAATWIVDVPLRSFLGDFHPYVADYQLRPIRDPGEDARDETLLWAGLPVKEVA